MKTIDSYIIEKLTLNNQSELNKYNFYPKNFKELRSLLKQLLDERGKDADLNDIDVSKVQSLTSNADLGLFENLDPHNIDISKWDVRNVINMNGLFWGCKNFNCNLSNWDVRNVENMRAMFEFCENFTGEGLEKWKPIKVHNMNEMFYKK